jgi:type IV pilus assembly protein PilO
VDIDIIVDKYRRTPFIKRFILVALVGSLPAVNYWFEEVVILQETIEQVTYQEDGVRRRLDERKLKVAELPALEAQIGAIEGELQSAKKILPDKIIMDKILAEIGYLEENRGVKVLRFEPGAETKPVDSDDYMELPVNLSVRGEFADVMDFYDSILHTPYLTHIRAISFSRADEIEGQGENKNTQSSNGELVVSKSKMILFKGTF